MSPEIQVMLAPGPTYRRLLLRARPISWVAALGRPAMSAVVLGTSLAVWATGHVSGRLVLSLTVCWSFVIAIQVLAALALIVPVRRRVTVPTALDLLFVAHGPWSLWLMGSAVWVIMSSPIGRPARFHAATGLVPAVWTALMVFAFCRVVLECDRRDATRRTLLHQGIIWSVTLGIFAFAVQLWPRIEAWLR